MLWLALIYSTVILIVTIFFAKYRQIASILATCAIGSTGCLCIFSFAVLMQCVLTAISTFVLRNPERGFRVFSVLAVASMILSYLLAFTLAVREQKNLETLQEEYPVISLDARLPNPPKDSEPIPWNVRLYEDELPDKSNTREISLSRLHQKQFTDFVNSPGFGVTRMPLRLNHLEIHPVPDSVPQPVKPKPGDSGNGEILSSGSLDGTLSRLHLSGIIDFVNQAGFGYFKNRNEVTGFRPHRFSKLPDSQGRWTIQSVELISLLKHETPGVYLSDNLPRMDQLADAKTRPLDAFERDGLEAVRKGENLFASGDGNSIRMIGAVRSVQQCVQCHSCERGDLLGAFSYRLKMASVDKK